MVFWDSREAARVYYDLQNNSISFQEGGTPNQLHCFRVERDVVEQASTTELATDQPANLMQKYGRGLEYEFLWQASDSVILIEAEGPIDLTDKVVEVSYN